MHVVADENIPFVKDAFAGFGEVTLLPGRKITRSDCANAEMLLVRSVTDVTSELLAGTPVTFVASATIGIDHIDTSYLERNDISFAYAPGSNADSVAQYVVASLFVLKHRYGFDFNKQTLGIIGAGNIGSRMYRHGKSLGMNVLLCDPPKQRETGSSLYLPFEEVVADADILTFHVPLHYNGDDKTFHLVDDAFFGRAKKELFLINTSRGKVVDEASLLSRRDHLGGLVLDVGENEPAVDTALLSVADIATPHIAGYSFDGKVNGTYAIYQAACACFNVQPAWSPAQVLSEQVTLPAVPDGADPVAWAVSNAYPILEDDGRMRRLLTLDTQQQRVYFDELRKTYPKRMEFQHFTPDDKTYDGVARSKLHDLGFNC